MQDQYNPKNIVINTPANAADETSEPVENVELRMTQPELPPRLRLKTAEVTIASHQRRS